VATAKNEPRYVYGVVRAAGATAPAVEGIAGAPLELVAEGEVAALTSPAPGEYMEAGREELLTHSRVLEATMEKATVLPMRFGVVVPDEEALRGQLLAPHREELAAQLDEIEGKVEVSLKGIYDEDAVLREIVAENRQVASLRERIGGKPAEAAYYERIELGELVAQAFEAKREHDAAAIVEVLRPHAVAVEVGEPVHERMALNASFLVERAGLEKFDRAVEEVGRSQADRIRFKYTGPLPPHSFVELEVAA